MIEYRLCYTNRTIIEIIEEPCLPRKGERYEIVSNRKGRRTQIFRVDEVNRRVSGTPKKRNLFYEVWISPVKDKK